MKCVSTLLSYIILIIIILGAPMLALTGTADSKTQNVIISQLAMKNPIVLFITPNQKNLRITVVKTKKNQMFCHLLWLVKLMGERVRNSKDNNLL